MTKQLYILLFALIFSGSSMAQDQVISADDAFEQWENSLNTHLLTHAHPYIQAIGLSLSHPDLPLINDADERFKLNHEQQNYVDHINQLAKQNTLSSETIFLLLSLCANDTIRDACDRQSLINQYQQQYPDDLNAYFEVFNQAVNNQDNAMAEYMLKNMRDATYITDMTVLPEVAKSVIKDYMDENPLARSIIQKQFVDLAKIDDSISNKQLNQAFYYVFIAGIQMALPIPAYKPLLDYCSSESSPTEACVEIADTLITQGNNIISQSVGHALKVKSLARSNERDLLAKAEEEKTQYKSYYKCIRDALSKNSHNVDYLDIAYAQLWFSDDNELQRIKSAAHYLFNKAHKSGFSDVKDPNECDIESIKP